MPGSDHPAGANEWSQPRGGLLFASVATTHPRQIVAIVMIFADDVTRVYLWPGLSLATKSRSCSLIP